MENRFDHLTKNQLLEECNKLYSLVVKRGHECNDLMDKNWDLRLSRQKGYVNVVMDALPIKELKRIEINDVEDPNVKPHEIEYLDDALKHLTVSCLRATAENCGLETKNLRKSQLITAIDDWALEHYDFVDNVGPEDMTCDMCGETNETVGLSGCDHPEHATIQVCQHCDIDGEEYNDNVATALKEFMNDQTELNLADLYMVITSYHFKCTSLEKFSFLVYDEKTRVWIPKIRIEMVNMIQRDFRDWARKLDLTDALGDVSAVTKKGHKALMMKIGTIRNCNDMLTGIATQCVAEVDKDFNQQRDTIHFKNGCLE